MQGFFWATSLEWNKSTPFGSSKLVANPKKHPSDHEICQQDEVGDFGKPANEKHQSLRGKSLFFEEKLEMIYPPVN